MEAEELYCDHLAEAMLADMAALVTG
jgi:hypothetical protein